LKCTSSQRDYDNRLRFLNSVLTKLRFRHLLGTQRFSSKPDRQGKASAGSAYRRSATVGVPSLLKLRLTLGNGL
jgi:hypothetical protein